MINTLTLQEILTNICEHLIQSGWQASILIVTLILLRPLLQKWISPVWIYSLWFLVIIRLLVPILPESSFSAESWTSSPVTVASIATTTPEITMNRENTATVIEPFFAESLLWIWLSGFTLLLLLALYQLRSMRSLLSRSRSPKGTRIPDMVKQISEELDLRTSVRIRLVPHLPSPAVTGCFHPTLLLPGTEENYTDTEKLFWLIRHELTHIRHGDLYIQWLSWLALAFHWFNPLVWITVYLMQRDRERACDYRVLDGKTTRDRQTYGELLIQWSQGFSSSFPQVGMAENSSGLAQRIQYLSTHRCFSGIHLLGTVTLALILSSLFLTHGSDETTIPASQAPTVSTAEQHLINLRLQVLSEKILATERISWENEQDINQLSNQGLGDHQPQLMLHYKRKDQLSYQLEDLYHEYMQLQLQKEEFVSN